MTEPWLAELRRLGVTLRLGSELTGLDVQEGRIRSAVVRGAAGRERIVADWYVCALPVERARALWTRDVLRADPTLARMHRLQTGWMNGIQVYLNRPAPVAHGIVAYSDSPWALTSISQPQFWRRNFAATYGDGSMVEKLSAAIANWNRPGVVYGRPATRCTPQEIKHEVWQQLKQHLNDSGRTVLSDDMLVAMVIDPGMLPFGGFLRSENELVLPSVGSVTYRPPVTTAIGNLLLAGDYLDGPWEVANMEAASHSARAAVSALLDRAHSKQAPPLLVDPYQPPEWQAAKRVDEQRWAEGQPNVLDRTQGPGAQARQLLTQSWR